MAPYSVLAIAVASKKAAFVFLQDGAIQDWGITVKYTADTHDFVGFVQSLISDLQPDVVVTEKCGQACRKGKNAKRLISAVAELASHNSVLDISVNRPRRYKSKYEEAAVLVEEFPELTGYLPAQKRRFFDFEPRNMVLFEALALANEIDSQRKDSV